LERDNFRCQYCGKNGKDVSLEVDHIIPKAEGWTDDFDNLITCCRECNIGKWKDYVWVNVNIGKLKLAERESKMIKWFFDEWNKLNNWKINKKNLSFISSFVKTYYYYPDFCNRFIKIVNADKITQSEFESGWEKCERVLDEFDVFARVDLEYILENLESGNKEYSSRREWGTNDYNVRLNRLITYQMSILKFPKSLIYKYSLCPNKIQEWENEEF
jgi:hypothetical protein